MCFLCWIICLPGAAFIKNVSPERILYPLKGYMLHEVLIPSDLLDCQLTIYFRQLCSVDMGVWVEWSLVAKMLLDKQFERGFGCT